eukprot:maker-scaffold172_size289735-snap-gene-0.17 protein:Tk06512 transcript:maker-scaffold172_size289735-snap-gene-0.17-mRNA-1 annotation:"histone h1"
MPDSPAKTKKVAKPKAAATHPPTSVMVMAAVRALKERNGSSLPAIKKYIAANYKVDVAKNAHFIKKAVKSLVEKKKLTQPKGTGASGSFKIPTAVKVEKTKVVKPKKVKTPKKKTATKKVAGEKKAKSPKKKTPAKKAATKKVEKPAVVAKKPKTPKKKPAKVAKPKAAATHPPTSVMVMAAVRALKERNGSSLPAIKKYIAANYKVDVAKNAHFIKKAVKSLVEKKKLTQPKGTGASGSFKIPTAVKVEKTKVVKPKKAKTPKKKTATKKVAGEKKAKSPKKKTPAKKAATKKVEKPAVVAKKPKTPKKKPAVKKAAPAKKTPAKKTSPKKRGAPKKK